MTHQQLYATITIRQQITSDSGLVLVNNVPGKIKSIVDKIFIHRARYQGISGRFANPIRWYHIALIHYLECSLNFNCYLGNGQPLRIRTTIVPAGRGPFKTFEEGAVDAIRLQRLDQQQDWSIGNTLYLLEGYNGYGYSKYRGINSPYIYSGTNHYTSGKYVSDGKYDEKAISVQIGVAPLLQEILKRLAQ